MLTCTLTITTKINGLERVSPHFIGKANKCIHFPLCGLSQIMK